MLFNSHLFLFAFLPVTLALYHVLARHADFRLALGALVACSLVFYGWWNPAYLVLLLGSIGGNFLVGRRLIERPDRVLLSIGVGGNLALIGYYKYANFFVDSLDALVGTEHTLHAIVLPLGISFFTFQQITWLVDAHRGDGARYTPLEYAQFVTFFPQLIAGPIVHHHEMLPQFTRHRALSCTSANLSIGLTILVVGLFKKVVLADSVAVYATPVFDAAEGGVAVTIHEAWVGALAYTLQLYFDFSGYSDMAIGLARLFGIVLPMNFASPYKATSVIDFWRRWHMTLSRFLRDYLYVPLGGNRRGEVRRHVNVVATMLLGGLWHGAGWTFVAWGGLHGLYLVINHAWRRWRGARRAGTGEGATSGGGLAPFSRTLTLLAVIVAWVVFRAESGASALALLRAMAGLDGIPVPDIAGALPLVSSLPGITVGSPFPNRLVDPLPAVLWIAALSAIALLAPNTQEIMARHRPVLEPVVPVRLAWRPTLPWAIVVALVGLTTALQLSGVSEFLYFRF